MGLIATAIDDDGGVQTVQIYLDDITHCRDVSPELGQCSTASSTHTPVAENADTSKVPGDRASTRRTAAYTIDIFPLTQGYAYVKVRAHAEGKNFHGGSDTTQLVTFIYKQQ